MSARRPRAARARVLTVAGVLAALPHVMGAGCDLFSTRDPVVADSQESLWTPPTSPEIVVTNLELAFETANLTDYRRALTDDFAFQADGADVAQLAIERPGEPVYDNWDREVEVGTAETIAGSVDSLALAFVQFDDDLGQAVRLLKYDYVLTLYFGTTPVSHEGEAWFQIRQEANGEWLIVDWEDVASASPVDSWGLLKGRNRLDLSRQRAVEKGFIPTPGGADAGGER